MTAEPHPEDIGTGHAVKVSVSMPDDLVKGIRERVGPREFSRYVSEAARRQYQLDLLGEIVSDYESRHGPIPAELMEEAEREWQQVFGH